MKENEIKKKLELTKNIFIEKHSILLKMNVNERSITHKFAECMEILFEGWDIDCEYNRDGYDDPKIINLPFQSINSNDEEAKTIYPDIIVHIRNTNKNLLVIEAKKDANERNSISDIEKLTNIKNQLGYNFAFFLNFKTGETPDIFFYSV